NPDIVNLDRGLYLQRDFLPWPRDAIDQFLQDAVALLRARREPLSSQYLIDTLGTPALDGMTWLTAKTLLAHEEGVQSMFHSHQVVWGEAFDPETASLAVVVEKILHDADRPLSSPEVIERFGDLDYHPVGTNQVLKREAFCLRVGLGRYIHRDRAGLHNRHATRLLDAMAAELVPGDVGGIAPICDRVIAQSPALVFWPTV